MKEYMWAILKAKFKRFIIRKVLIPTAIVVFFITLVVTLPMIVVESISDTFSSWFKSQNKSYATANDAMLDWIDTLDDEIDLGEDFLPKKWMKRYIMADNESILPDVELNLKEYVSVHTSYSEEGRSSSSSSYTNDIKYKLQLYNATKNYNTPWQILSMQHTLSDMPYDEDTFNLMLDKFGTKYYGLLEGSEIVTSSNISSGSDFRFKKTVKKTTVETSEYYKTVIDKETGEREQEGPYTKTVTKESVIEYPLPYFTQITTMLNSYYFDYEMKTTESSRSYSSGGRDVDVTTVITEPVLKFKDSSVDAERYLSNLDSINLSAVDLEYMQELVANLPNGNMYIAMFDWFLDENYIAYDDSNISPDVLYKPSQIVLNFDYPSLSGRITRDDVLKVSKSILGLPYFWGGKYPHKGFNENWGKLRLVTASGNRNTGKYIPYGLDCSGYVDWVYYQLTGTVISKGGGAGSQYMNSTPIDEKDLKVGDLGFYANPYTNGGLAVHTGIFIGRDSDGVAMFIHCGGSHYGDASRPNGQVIISKQGKAYNGYPSVRFKYFARPKVNFND